MFLSATGAKNGHKRKWKKSEIQAVERHLLYFINQHKVPQKYDCIVCLEAEPEALRNRSWKGVKDYVRNRITALKNASRCRSDDSEEPQQQTQRWGGSTESEAARSLHPFDQIQYRFHTTRRLWWCVLRVYSMSQSFFPFPIYVQKSKHLKLTYYFVD